MFLLRFLGRAIRRALAMVLFLLIRGRKVVLAVAALLIVGWIAFANLNKLPIPAGTLPSWVPSGASTASTTAASPGRSSAPPATKLGAINADAVPSVDSYIKGLTQFDAKLMWGALSEEAIQSMRSRGGSLDALQAGLDDAKKRGARYEDITMIGNYPLQDGRKYLFYVLSRRGFGQQDQLEQVYFIFTVNKDGKIARIE
jgi:hypothetical protein